MPAQPQTSEPAAAPPSSDALTWHGITLYGAYDIGVGYVTHGLPENGYNYEGASLVNRNGYQHRFLIAPNNLQQTGFGVRGKEGNFHGWSAVFNLSTGINPQSGLLANASATQTINNGLPRSSYSYAIDGARAGQPINDEFYGGVSSTNFGTLTFGRQRSLGTDAMLLYDPVAGGYAFSYIGYNGTMAGGGDTENTRWDDAVKYRISYGPAHFGAMYKFADGNGGCYSASATWTAANCTPESAHNNAYGFDVGGEYGKLSADIVYQHYNQAISVLNPLLGAQSVSQPFESTTNSINTNPINGANVVGTTNTVYGIVTDNNGVIGAVKYTLKPIKFFAGYEYIWQNNPRDPLGVGASDQGGYIMSGVEDNNLDREDFRQIWWTGAKYTYRSKTDFVLAWYQQRQSNFRTPPTCSVGGRVSRFLRGHPQRGVVLSGSSLHQAVRHVCRRGVLLCDRRPGDCDSARPRCAVLLQQQHGSDGRWPVCLLIVLPGGRSRSAGGTRLLPMLTMRRVLVLGCWLVVGLWTRPGMAADESDGPVVKTSHGGVRGALERGAGGTPVAVFRGIPYAKAPTGKRRWAPPEEMGRWMLTREATQFGPACAQWRMGWNDRFAGESSEDCLYLNVWSTAVAGKGAGDEGKLPVLVYLHGGSNQAGTASEDLANGLALAPRGVLLVTVNYRVGVFGFLSSAELRGADGASGNYGLRDQIAALRWVQGEIGGVWGRSGAGDDPGAVGRSAGCWGADGVGAGEGVVCRGG